MTDYYKKMLARKAYINPRGGDEIHRVIEEMIHRADTFRIRVTCVFNEAQFIVVPGMTAEAAYQLWQAEMDRQGRQWSKSMKAEVSRREWKAEEERDAVREQNVRAMLKQENIEVPWYKRWAFNKVVRLNSTNDGAEIVNYATAWAVAMQQEMRKGKKIADVAEELSHEVDYQGMSGFTHGLAVSFLTQFWKYGEELRRWHNLNTQLGDEGEQANKKKGVTLNPALLSFGKE